MINLILIFFCLLGLAGCFAYLADESEGFESSFVWSAIAGITLIPTLFVGLMIVGRFLG